ncbi:MAG: beta-mannosidase [Rhodobacterales bacterium]|nr:MAG: beta-mannosidase [Rhodobacterales bacterium]
MIAKVWIERAKNASIAGLGLGVATLTASLVQAAPPGEVPFGVYDPPGDFQNDSDVLIEHLFLPWEDVYLPSLLDADGYALERSRALLVTIEPWTWVRSERNTADKLKEELAAGEVDHYMRDICEVLGEMKSPITVRWAQEMDNPTEQFIWSNWQPEDYISAYRRMIDICRAEAPNISAMWSPLGTENMSDYYPGDDYVDLIGVTVFGSQPYDERVYGQPRSFEEILGPRYAEAAAYGKPIVIAEMGFVGDAAYVEEWNNAIRQNGDKFPNLVGVVYFNQKEVYPWPDFTLPDWRVRNNVLTR